MIDGNSQTTEDTSDFSTIPTVHQEQYLGGKSVGTDSNRRRPDLQSGVTTPVLPTVTTTTLISFRVANTTIIGCISGIQPLEVVPDEPNELLIW